MKETRGWASLAAKGLAGIATGVGLLTLGAVNGSGVRQEASPAIQVAAGEALVNELGCGACHEGVAWDGSVSDKAPALGVDATPLAPAYVFQYLANPQRVRPNIGATRMPSYDLGEDERVALSLFVSNETTPQGVDEAFRAALARHPESDRARGAFLFSAYNCSGCHTHPDAVLTTRQAGPSLEFEGARVSPEWLEAYLRDPVPIRPSGTPPGSRNQMPDFRLTEEELVAVTAYVTTLGSGELPEWEPALLSPFSMEKAETLLRGRWSCLGCHQLGDEGGMIGPALNGLSERLTPEFLRTVVESPGHVTPGTVMPASFEQADRLDLIASYLWQRQGVWSPAERLNWEQLGSPIPGSALAASEGSELYERSCASCHGTTGMGDGFNASFLPTVPTLHGDSAAMALRPDDTLYDGIHAGGRVLGKSHRMPAFGASLSVEEIRSLVAHIRQLCQCEGPLWSRDGIGR